MSARHTIYGMHDDVEDSRMLRDENYGHLVYGLVLGFGEEAIESISG